MRFETIVLATMTALSLAACGTSDDKAKPEDGKTNLPEKSQECVAAGDACVLEGDKWVVKDGKDDKTMPRDEVPAADSGFDYSDIGVTDVLEPEKRGFAFWHKGSESPLNAKTFAKNKPTLSPSIQWTSKLNYDVDLWNFVAVTLDNGDKNAQNKPKFMFDEIGVENQKDNKNLVFFGKGAHDKATDDSNPVLVGVSSFSAADGYAWNSVPALVNTFMYRNNKDGWSVYHAPDSKYFLNQEEESTNDMTGADGIGSGATRMRVYGANAFLSVDAATAKDNFLKTDGTPYQGAAAKDKGELYELEERSGEYVKHANFAWYKLSTKGRRVGKAHVETGSFKSVVDDFAAKKVAFPTDIELDELRHTQFGRLTGEGIDPEADKIEGYDDELLKKYPFTPSKKAAAAGNDKGEDWYFARGTEPAPLSTLENLKSAGSPVVYDGQAVMFGIDYDPRKPLKAEESKNGQSTNAVKPIDQFSKADTLLDGKQNFVRLTWDPASGDVKGSVYGVWTKATFWRANKDDAAMTKVKQGNAYVVNVVDGKLARTDDQVELKPFENDRAENKKSLVLVTGGLLTKAALRAEPWVNPLVVLNGKVVEGSNSFGGSAERVKDGSKGLFSGAFFGRDASEVGGVINSQTGSLKNADLADPASKWGGAFGAKSHRGEVAEDLVFEDAKIDYGTSTEFFNTNQ